MRYAILPPPRRNDRFYCSLLVSIDIAGTSTRRGASMASSESRELPERRRE